MDAYEKIEESIAERYGKARTTRKATGDFMLEEDHAVNIKSNNVEKRNYSPNMISIKKLHEWVFEQKNQLSFIFVDYREGTNGIEVLKESPLVPIQHISWDCLTIEAQGYGVIQKNAELKIDPDQSLRTFYEGFLTAYDRFMEKERLKHARFSGQFIADLDTIGPAAAALTAASNPTHPRGAVALLAIDDLETEAFKDIGRNIELARVLAGAADKIRDGVPAPFPLEDTNGNEVGRFDIVVAAPLANPEPGTVRLQFDLNQPAFQADRDGQLSRYIAVAADQAAAQASFDRLIISTAQGQIVGTLDMSAPSPRAVAAPLPQAVLEFMETPGR